MPHKIRASQRCEGNFFTPHLCPFFLDPVYQTLRIGEKIIRLSPMENKLLYFLSIQPETCAKRPPIILYLWPEVRSSRKKDNHLDVCISRLRKKIDEEVGKKPLVTHEKHHYRFIYPLILDR